MRVCFFIGFIPEPETGGAHTFLSEIINAITGFNTSHEIYVYYRSDKNIFEDTINIKFINLLFEYTEVEVEVEIKKFIFKKVEIEIVRHYKSFDDLILRDKISLVYYLLSPPEQVLDVPYISTVWDLAHRENTYFPEVSITGWNFDSRELTYKAILPKSAFVIIGNNEGKRQVCQYYGLPEERVKSIPMPTPSYVYKIKENISVLKDHNLEINKYLFYPAQFWPHKNHIRLVKAMIKLKDNGFKMVFTGHDMGNRKYIEEKIKEYKLEGDILILGFVEREKLIALYKNAFCLVYASYLGPDNIPPLEAMALECPVICSDNKGMREQLRDAALFFDPNNENDIIDKINKLDEKTKYELISKGKILANEYSIDNYVENIFKIIDEFVPIRECWSSDEPFIHL